MKNTLTRCGATIYHDMEDQSGRGLLVVLDAVALEKPLVSFALKNIGHHLFLLLLFLIKFVTKLLRFFQKIKQLSP